MLIESPKKILKRRLLIERNLTVTESAKILRIGRVALSCAINGRSKLSMKTLVKIADYLHEDLEYWCLIYIRYDIAVKKKNKGLI